MISPKTKREIPLYIMLLPGVALVFVFNYLPMGGIIIAFQNYKPSLGFFNSAWVGLNHFRFMFMLPDTYLIIRNTLFIAGMKMIANFVFPILLALLLNEVMSNKFKKRIQTIIYLPHFLSWIILGGMLRDMLSLGGIINQIIAFFGFTPLMFLGDKTVFPWVIIVTDVWKNLGFNTIVFLAALTNINTELYESAAIDGAGYLKRTRHVTLPGMSAIIILIGTLSLGSILNAGFEQIFALYSPIVYETGDIIDTFVYRMGLVQSQYSLATAVGLLKSGVSFILVSLSYFLAFKFGDYRIF